MALEGGALAMVADPCGEVGRSKHPLPAEATPGRVLIIEDDPALAENLQEIVELFGYEAVAVPSAEAALAEVGQRRIDFIVTDHRLPGMSGAAFLGALRSEGRTIPSVMTTAWIADPEADDASESGLTEVLTKPIDIQRLLFLIRTVLGPGTSSVC